MKKSYIEISLKQIGITYLIMGILLLILGFYRYSVWLKTTSVPGYSVCDDEKASYYFPERCK